MLHINKYTHRKFGLAIITDFLNNHCMDVSGRYFDVRYDDRDAGSSPTFCYANGRTYRRNMAQLLLENQNHYCCYCLRRLKALRGKDEDYRSLTFEHIIPRGFTKSDNVEYYQTAPGLSPAEVVMKDEFESADYIQKNNLHPHNIAYNNLVISCNGTFPEALSKQGGRSKICCNAARNELNAYPIYFHIDVASYIEYLPDGNIQASLGTKLEEKVRELIINTRLDCDALKDVRRMWYILRLVPWEELSLCSSNQDKRRFLLSRLLFEKPEHMERNTNLFIKFLKTEYWETLMLYAKFHQIMGQLYP